MRRALPALAVVITVSLAGCGGGGDGSPPPAVPRSDLSVAVSGPAANVASGTSAGFSVVVTNAGPDAASGVAINLAASTGLTLGAVSCASAGGGTCPASLGASMTVTSLPNGGSLTFTVPTSVAPGVSGSVSLSATVGATNDSQASNNSSTAVAVAYSADVTLQSSAPSGMVAGGGVANFGVVLGNAGPDTALNVALSITPEAGLTPGALTCTASGGATCPSALSSNVTIPTLPKGGTLTIGIPATVTAGTNGKVSVQATATSAGDPTPGNNSTSASAITYSANLSVSTTATATVGSGGTAYFQSTVANSGPAASQNVVITTSVSGGYAIGAMSCTAAGGASCPASVNTTTTVSTLPVGGSLILTIPVAVPAGASGSVTATVSASAAGDPVGTNNTAAATTQIATDPRSGTYHVYAANGVLYSLAIDFTSKTYAISSTGGGTSGWSGSFTADSSGGGFTIAGNARFRVRPDLIVGGFDFGGGVVSFVAARSFVTTAAELTGDFIYLGLNLPTSGATRSRIFPGRLDGLEWRICLDLAIYPMPNCPPASVWTYTVTSTSDVGEWLAVDSVHADTARFRVAKSGAERIFLRAGDSPDGKRFRIGLPNTWEPAAGTYTGAGTRGEWLTVSLSDSVYSASGTLSNGSPTAAAAALTTVSGLTGLRSGVRSSDGASVFVIRSDSIFALAGAQSGPADGAMQIGAK